MRGDETDAVFRNLTMCREPGSSGPLPSDPLRPSRPRAAPRLRPVPRRLGARDHTAERVHGGRQLPRLARLDLTLNGKGYEKFDSGWANAVYLYELPPAQLVACAFGAGAVEDCETGWSNVPYLRDWALVTGATGVFDGGVQAVEDFNNAWTNMTTL